MNETEVRALLAACVAYDNRRPSTANIAAWCEAANRAGWTFHGALDAIHAHYAESTAFLMPGHITARIAEQRIQGNDWPPPYVALPAAQPADESTRRRIMAMVGDRFRLRRGRPVPNTTAHARARVAAKAALDEKRGQLDAIRPDEPSPSAVPTPESR